MPADSVSGEAPSLVQGQRLLAGPSPGGSGNGALGGLSHMNTDPIYEGPTLVTSHLPKTAPPATTTLWVRISTSNPI